VGAEKVRTTEDILAPPGESDVARALELFAAAVRAAYGDRVSGLFLFGSRARGDFEPFSDADVAVVLNDEDWALVRETRRLARLANEVLIETGVEIQAWPVSRAAWDDPAHHPETALVENMRRDAKAVAGLLGNEERP
jgi:antitoxin ChpS